MVSYAKHIINRKSGAGFFSLLLQEAAVLLGINSSGLF
jgi:hypothetical protein